MPTLTTAAQLDALPAGTIITPADGGRTDTAYHTHAGHYLLCGSINEWSADALVGRYPEWVQVAPARPVPADSDLTVTVAVKCVDCGTSLDATCCASEASAVAAQLADRAEAGGWVHQYCPPCWYDATHDLPELELSYLDLPFDIEVTR